MVSGSLKLTFNLLLTV